MFNEHDEKANDIMLDLEAYLIEIEIVRSVRFKEPYHDIARRFLGEIVEFEPLDEERRSSLKPWEEG